VLQCVSGAIADEHRSPKTALAVPQSVAKAANSLRDSVDGFHRKVTI